MKPVPAFRLLDGTVVDGSLERAKRVAEKRYGDALTKLAIEVARLDGKYQTTQEFIDKHLEEFAHLKALRDDCEIPQEDNDE